MKAIKNKYERFDFKLKGLHFSIKLLDEDANFNGEMQTLFQEFKVIVRNSDKEINFKFYNSPMERDISIFLKKCNSIEEFKNFMNKKMWGGYDKVRNFEQLKKERIRNLIYSIISDMGFNLFAEYTNLHDFIDEFGYEYNKRTEKIFYDCLEFQNKLKSLNLDFEQRKFLENAYEESEMFEETIHNLLIPKFMDVDFKTNKD